MDAHTLIEEWEVSPFDGGFDGLEELRSRRFSGCVEAGGSTLFVRDGEPLAVVEDLATDPRPGGVDAFEAAAGDRLAAPQSEAATLAAMLALDCDVRGRYFTEDTPLSTVHETLSEGGFTGYVELSENVLSGDYYVVYRDGREEHVAFVGSENRPLVGEEAQSKAEAEVGIFSVVAVDLPGVELPESTASGDGATAGPGAGGPVAAGTPTDEANEAATRPAADDVGRDAGGGDDPDSVAEAGVAEDVGSADDAAPEVGNAADAAAGDEPTDEHTLSPAGAGDVDVPKGSDRTGVPNDDRSDAVVAATDRDDREPDRDPDEVDLDGADPDRGGSAADRVDGATRADDERAANGAGAGLESPDEPPGGVGADSTPDPTAGNGSDAGTGGATARADGSDGDVIDAVTARTVPSLDPTNSRGSEGDADGGSSALPVGGGSRATAAAAPESRSAAGGGSTPSDGADRTSESERESEPEPDREPEADVDARIDAVREEYEERIEDLRTELAELRSERDDLRRRLESLEGDGSEPAPDAGVSLTPSEAIAGTSLFVREGTRGGATLEDARDGATDRETLAENVRVEYHAEFDDEGATVEGRPFEEWLRSTPHYRFVRWAIVDLLFEIRSTGSTASMRPLYDALPEVDRIGLCDAVAVGNDGGREIAFDVVARNRMGDPLFVATIDESREPTAGEAMEPLLTDASDVCEYNETLAGTFAVTSSYFEPEALGAVREATSGSLLGRDKYRSYVKLARKNGFHVCTVERREGTFHLTAPEL